MSGEFAKIGWHGGKGCYTYAKMAPDGFKMKVG